jgi:sarcosine oxidase, subunit beta
VIIGGGVIGCAIAYWLTELGVRDVVLLEKDVLAGGETGICPGGIRQQFDREADCILARHSVRFYEHIAERLEAEHPFTFERSGYLFVAHEQQTLEQYRHNVTLQNRLGIPSRMLTPGEIRTLVPEISVDGVRGASFCDEDGFLEDCHGVTFSFVAAARRRGLRTMLHTEARALGAASGGGWEVQTTDGALGATHVVLAAGVASAALAQSLGLRLPIREVKRRLLFTQPSAPGRLRPLLVAADRGVAAKQLNGGVFYLGWLRETEHADDLAFIEASLSSASTVLPMFGDLGAKRIVRGRYDLTPDHRPILGAVPGFPGIHIATGFSGHGFMIAPAVGEIVACGVCEKDCPLPVAPFSLARFDAPAAAESLYI